MECPECRFQNPEGIKYCGECGKKLTIQCPNCGFFNPSTFKFCGQCKCDLASRQSPSPTRQNSKSERKYVTILFSDLAGYTAMTEMLDPEEVRPILEKIFNRISAIIESLGGFVERYIGDSVMAVFGIPKAHEDDPARALLAAMKIHDTVKSMNVWVEKKLGRPISMHTGINSGLVVTGNMNPDTGSYGMTGLDLNIASRLEGIAREDEIIVGHKTYLLTKMQFNYNELEPVAVKGKKGLVRIFKLVSSKKVAPLTYSPPDKNIFVGREKEMGYLSDALNQLINERTGSIISITGEPGIGKSKLLEEYKKQLGNLDLLLLQSQSSSLDQENSYGTLLEILKDYAGIKHTDDNIKSWNKLEARLTQLASDEVVNSLPYLATILSIHVKDDLYKKVQFLDAETMKSQVFRAFYLFVKALVKRRPLLLVFEDFHWSDESTSELLAHLFPIAKKFPLQIVLICRNTTDSPLTRLENQLNGSLKELYYRINLGALSKEHLINMATKILDLDSISSQLIGLIHRKSEGNPLYLEELTRVLVDNELIEKNPATGQHTIKPISGKIQIPDTLRGLVSSSVDNLDKDIKDVLKKASVIGRNFLYRLLEVLEEQKNELDSNISVLIDQNLIRKKSASPELEYYFYHDLVKDAVYEAILVKERKRLHLKIAQAIEIIFKNQIESFYSLLSYHYAKASEWNKATRYFRLSGDQASRIAGDSEALAHYKKAITANEELFDSQLDDLEKASYTRKLGEIYFRRGENDKALDSFKQAFELLGIKYPFDLWRTRLGIIKLVTRQFIRRFFLNRFQRNSLVDENKKTIEKYTIFESIAWIDFYINQERFAYDVLIALDYAEKKRNPDKLIMTYSGFALILNTMAFYRFAIIYHNLSEKLLHFTQDQNTLGTFYMCKAIHLDYTGQWNLAIEFYTNGANAFEKSGQLKKWGSLKSLLTIILIKKGEFKSVEQYTNDICKIGIESGDSQLKGWGFCVKGIFQLRMGNTDEAIKDLIESKILLASIPDNYALVVTLIDLMNGYIHKKNFKDAYHTIIKAENLIHEKKLKGYILSDFRNAISDLYLKLIEANFQFDKKITMHEAKKYVSKTISLGLKYSGGLCGAYRVTGKYCWLKNRQKKAVKNWEKGIKVSQELGARYEEGLIRLEMGRCHRDVSELNKAKEIFLEINSKYELGVSTDVIDGIDSIDGKPSNSK